MGVRFNVNGVMGEEGQTLLSPLDHGFVFGASVYETIRTYGGRPFLLRRHLHRLRDSAESLSISLTTTDEELVDRVHRTIAAASNTESYVRIIVSAGVGELDYRIDKNRKPTVVILVRPLPDVPSELHTEGIAVVIVEVIRNHPKSVSPSIKTSSLLNNMLAMREALSRGAQEALMLNYRGEVAESSLANVFMVRDGGIKTPALEAGILAGITRELTLQLADELGFRPVETTIMPEELKKADEVFLTSSTREVLPVVRIDELEVGDGKPGPVTNALLQAYRKSTSEDCR